MARYIPATEVAKLVRKALKPLGHRFSVKTEQCSLSASISVRWVDGPTEAEVEAVAGQFHGGTFDGMTDSTNYHDSDLDGESVRFGNRFIFFSRDASAESERAAKEAVMAAADLDEWADVPVEVAIIDGEAKPCGGARDYSACLARQLFAATSYAPTKSKLERVYF